MMKLMTPFGKILWNRYAFHYTLTLHIILQINVDYDFIFCAYSIIKFMFIMNHTSALITLLVFNHNKLFLSGTC